ncbi:hypothetical protein SLA2020_209110 [Shorea laevis]
MPKQYGYISGYGGARMHVCGLRIGRQSHKALHSISVSAQAPPPTTQTAAYSSLQAFYSYSLLFPIRTCKHECMHMLQTSKYFNSTATVNDTL